MPGKNRIGVFGGSFNPPHMGHLLAAVYALKIFELDEVWLVPAYRHAFDKQLLPFPVRLSMCNNLVKGLGPGLKVSAIEKEIRSDGKTLHTLFALRKKYPARKFLLIAGSDVLREAKKWYRFKEIKKKFGVLVVPRAKILKTQFQIPGVSSSVVRRRIANQKSLENLLTPEIARSMPGPNRSNRRRSVHLPGRKPRLGRE